MVMGAGDSEDPSQSAPAHVSLESKQGKTANLCVHAV